MMIHDLKPIIAWYPKAIGTSVTCYLRFIANPHKETRGFIKSKTKHRIIIQPHQVVGKQNAGKYTKYPPIPSLPPFTLLQSPPTQPNPNRIRTESRASQSKALTSLGESVDPKTTQIRGDGIVPCGSQGCQLCSPGIPGVTKPRRNDEKWYHMICQCVFCFLFLFGDSLSSMNWSIYKKKVEMLDFHRKKAHGKAMISSSFVGYDLKSLIEGRRR